MEGVGVESAVKVASLSPGVPETEELKVVMRNVD